MGYFIRNMRVGDWDSVAEIYRQGIESGIATFRRDLPDFVSWDRAHINVCRLVVCDSDETVVGWAALSPTSSRIDYKGVCEISIYIDEKHKRKGLGKALMREIIDEAERNEIWTLQSVIFQENKASIKLHEKCGFRIVGYREKIARDRYNQWQNTILMELRSKKIF